MNHTHYSTYNTLYIPYNYTINITLSIIILLCYYYYKEYYIDTYSMDTDILHIT